MSGSLPAGQQRRTSSMRVKLSPNRALSRRRRYHAPMSIATLIRPEGTLNPFWAVLIFGGFAVWMWVSWRRKRGGAGSLSILGAPPPATTAGPDAFRAKLAAAFQQN